MQKVLRAMKQRRPLIVQFANLISLLVAAAGIAISTLAFVNVGVMRTVPSARVTEMMLSLVPFSLACGLVVQWDSRRARRLDGFMVRPPFVLWLLGTIAFIFPLCALLVLIVFASAYGLVEEGVILGLDAMALACYMAGFMVLISVTARSHSTELR